MVIVLNSSKHTNNVNFFFVQLSRSPLYTINFEISEEGLISVTVQAMAINNIFPPTSKAIIAVSHCLLQINFRTFICAFVIMIVAGFEQSLHDYAVCQLALISI